MPTYYDGDFDTGKDIIIPFLHSRGINEIDLVVLLISMTITLRPDFNIKIYESKMHSIWLARRISIIPRNARNCS